MSTTQSKPTTVPILFGIGIVLVIIGGFANQPNLPVVTDLAAKLGGIASGLMAAALIVERAVEMVLGVPRAANAQTIKNEIAVHETAAKAALVENKTAESGNSQTAATAAEGELAMYQEQTKRQAVALSFVLGAVLSVFGVRILAQFWTFPTTPSGWLTGADVFFTAAVLSAGGQGVHLLFSTIGNYLNSLKPTGK